MQMDTVQLRACEAIESPAYDFTAKYYAAFDLGQMARQYAGGIHSRTILALKGLLLGSAFEEQRQRRLLFREAAGVLATIMQLDRHGPLAQQAYDVLRAVLLHGSDHAHQAAAEALGGLPLDVRGSHLPVPDRQPMPSIGWKALLADLGLTPECVFSIRGRSLSSELPDGRLAVIKMARQSDEAPALLGEIQWMSYLSTLAIPGKPRFDVPESLEVKSAALFRIKGLPKEFRSPLVKNSAPLAIGYITTRAYFHYPNSPGSKMLPTADDFLEMMGRNAFLFGWLASRGIVHEAPIPLFHNRLQQHRRRDGGVYEWFRAGRLDRWLASCAFPNFGRSGLRDFEHFNSCDDGGLELYRHMGNQLLSLLMVAGSYFRAKAPHRLGWDHSGRPMDTRDLFDRDLLCRVVRAVYRQYHIGFTQTAPEASDPLNIDHLADRMIDEMGMDRHMEESLRVVDQQQMTPVDFEVFMIDRGYTAEDLAGIEKDARDLVLVTGPHLGAFNRGISIPELIEAAAAMAAVCVAESFLKSEVAQKTIISGK